MYYLEHYQRVRVTNVIARQNSSSVDDFLFSTFGIMASKWKAVPQSLLESMQATKTEHRRLGASGLYVSSPILGCMGIGCSAWDEWVLDEEKVVGLP